MKLLLFIAGLLAANRLLRRHLHRRPLLGALTVANLGGLAGLFFVPLDDAGEATAPIKLILGALLLGNTALNVQRGLSGT